AILFAQFALLELAAAQEDVVVTIQLSTSESSTARFAVVKEAFEAQNPHIRLELVERPADTETVNWTEQAMVQILAGSGPDVLQTWGPFHIDWAQRGLLMDLKPYVERDMSSDDIADYFPPTWLGGELCCG